ncbi:hypothetical protein SARC_02167 [Sphaeroforma arctica JP610]|uniref:SH3 domain-containing protein n=1 Tax=Sphaeroforma arctica JP610 TaxID=667725 RepID=A0A0L0G9U7_9EUKA|nr:hypothetical protein SARC_02167 [Sphaeroforma arctica JP610]KNC85646.1 hypothetical protein SARC_02167 [Sphaeroforma arctica JP610]|eukprot:XP_014159548.1 hypothetical protein SARC_02167 [Sphaeroforma arctica JP610]
MVKVARALYEYDKENNDEIAFKAGDMIEITNDFVYDGWMEGILLPGRTEKGLFPSNFVEVEEVADTKQLVQQQEEPEDVEFRDMQVVIGDKLPPSLTGGARGAKMVRAHHFYERTQPDELSFQEGDVIEVVSEDHPDWWQGKLNGVVGWLPSNFVEDLPQEPAQPEPEPEPQPSPMRAMPEAAIASAGDNVPKWKKDLLAKNAAKGQNSGAGDDHKRHSQHAHEEPHDHSSMAAVGVHRADAASPQNAIDRSPSQSSRTSVHDREQSQKGSIKQTFSSSLPQKEEPLPSLNKGRPAPPEGNSGKKGVSREGSVKSRSKSMIHMDSSSDDDSDEGREPDGFQLQKEILELKRLYHKERKARIKLGERVTALENMM